MEKKYYDFMVGKEVYYEGDVYKVTSAWEYIGVKDATLWYSLLAVAYLLWEDEDIAEQMIYDMWYNIV